MTTDQHTHKRLEIPKDLYDARMESLTTPIRSLYSSINDDEIIATMRDDPTTEGFIGQRIKEICEEGLAKEREQTITRLIGDLGEANARCFNVEREVSSVKRQLEECKLALKHQSIQAKASQEELVKLACLYRAKGDYEVQTSKHTQARQDHRDGRELGHREDEGPMSPSNLAAATTDKQRAKLAKAFEKIKELKGSLELYESEREEIRVKCLSYTKQFREALQTEQTCHAQATNELKTKISRLKRKVLEQRRTLNQLEGKTPRTKGESGKTSGRSQERHEDSLQRVAAEWEQRLEEEQTQHVRAISQLQKQHRLQIEGLQEQYQQLLTAKIKEMESDAVSQQQRQTMLDTELRRLFEDRLSSEGTRPTEDLSQLKSSYFSELSQLKASHELSLKRLTAELTEEHAHEISVLKGKVKGLESSLESVTAEQRKVKREADYSAEKLSSTKQCLENAQSEVEELDSTKKSLLKSLSEAYEDTAKLKTLYEEQVHTRQHLEAQLDTAKAALKEFKDQAYRQEQEASKQLHQQQMKFLEEVSRHEDRVHQEQANSNKAFKELDRLKRLLETLEKDKEVLAEELQKEAQNLLNTTQKIKQEEQRRFEKEAEEHLAVKRKLVQSESRVQYLSFELEGTGKVTDELRTLCRRYEEEVGVLRGKLQVMEHQRP
jgi:chromosome segregation ATPase